MNDHTHVAILPDSEEWHALRLRHIGASESTALFDLPPEQTPRYLLSRFALWHIKAGHVPRPEVDNPRTKWGLLLEEAIAHAAAEQEGWDILKGGYVSEKTTIGLGCTLDYVIQADPDEDGPGCLEIKNTDWLVHRRSWTDGEPPMHILLQLQHQCAATGYTWGAVAALVGGNDLRVYRYKARPALIAKIRALVTEFWASVARDEEPPVDGSSSAGATLAALYPELEDDVIDLSGEGEWPEACHDFRNAGELRRRANDGYEAAKNRVVRLLDGHARGTGDGWQVRCAVTPANLGREPKPGELIGVRKEVRKYTVRESTEGMKS